MDLWDEGRQRWSDRDVVIASSLPGAAVMARICSDRPAADRTAAASPVDERIDGTYVVHGWAGHDRFRLYARRRRFGTGMTRLATGTVHDDPDGGCTLHATFWITQFGPATMGRWLLAAVSLALALYLAGDFWAAANTLLAGWLVLAAVAVLGVTVADRQSRRAEVALESWLRLCAGEKESVGHLG